LIPIKPKKYVVKGNKKRDDSAYTIPNQIPMWHNRKKKAKYKIPNDRYVNERTHFFDSSLWTSARLPPSSDIATCTMVKLVYITNKIVNNEIDNINGVLPSITPPSRVNVVNMTAKQIPARPE